MSLEIVELLKRFSKENGGQLNVSDLKSPGNVLAYLAESSDLDDYNLRCDKIKAANSDGYPSFWIELAEERKQITSHFE